MDRGELLRTAEAISDPAKFGDLNPGLFESREAYIEAYVTMVLPQWEVELMGSVIDNAHTFGQWAQIEKSSMSTSEFEAVRQCMIQLSDTFQWEGFQTYEDRVEQTNTEGPVFFHRLVVFWGPDAKSKWLASNNQPARN